MGYAEDSEEVHVSPQETSLEKELSPEVRIGVVNG